MAYENFFNQRTGNRQQAYSNTTLNPQNVGSFFEGQNPIAIPEQFQGSVQGTPEKQSSRYINTNLLNFGGGSITVEETGDEFVDSLRLGYETAFNNIETLKEQQSKITKAGIGVSISSAATQQASEENAIRRQELSQQVVTNDPTSAQQVQNQANQSIQSQYTENFKQGLTGSISSVLKGIENNAQLTRLQIGARLQVESTINQWNMFQEQMEIAWEQLEIQKEQLELAKKEFEEMKRQFEKQYKLSLEELEFLKSQL